MRFASLGSGSKGNATVVHHQDTLILIDCGFSVKETERRLDLYGLHAGDLSAILVTHEHSDHIRGVLPLAKKYQLPVLMTAGTRKSLKDSIGIELEVIESHRIFQIGSIEVNPVSVAHDAREPVQFVFRAEGLTLGVLTDLGSVTPHVLDSYHRCDGLLMEFNHDMDMLANGPYPPSLKQRVSGDWGHLSNQQALRLLQNIQVEQLQRLVIGHISEKNNALYLIQQALEELEGSCPDLMATVVYADQKEGVEWQELTLDPRT